MKMKKILTLVLALALCLGLAAPALALEYGEEYIGYNPTATQKYKDVPATHWAMKSIDVCTERGWFEGYPDHTFRPEGLITREEAAKVFALALGLPLEDDPIVSFTDTRGNWAAAHIEATKILFPNVQNLQGTTSFRPTKTITREETVYALVVAWRFASKVINADLSILNMFSDQQTISVGVKPYMAVAVQEGLVSGLGNGTIAAQKGLTRAEFATLLARALDHGYGPDDTSAPQIILDRYPATTEESEITITGTIDPVSRGAQLKVSGMHQAIPVKSDGSFTVTLPLDSGVNSFTLTVTNLYQVSSQQELTITQG